MENIKQRLFEQQQLTLRWARGEDVLPRWYNENKIKFTSIPDPAVLDYLPCIMCKAHKAVFGGVCCECNTKIYKLDKK